jgi:hypothetical protein
VDARHKAGHDVILRPPMCCMRAFTDLAYLRSLSVR